MQPQNSNARALKRVDPLDISSVGRGQAPVTLYCLTKHGEYIEIIFVERHDEYSVMEELIVSEDESISSQMIFIISDVEQAKHIQSSVKGVVIFAVALRNGGYSFLEY